jgi:hypothetical protein
VTARLTELEAARLGLPARRAVRPRSGGQEGLRSIADLLLPLGIKIPPGSRWSEREGLKLPDVVGPPGLERVTERDLQRQVLAQLRRALPAGSRSGRCRTRGPCRT